MSRISHPFEPLYDHESRILILGSFPSVVSREQNFYYANKTNRFWKVMEKLRCETAPQVLSGAVYAVLVSGWDFDRAMIAAVNHSGRSAAVGAIAGAILGARLGEESLPEFYVECLEPGDVLRELADDLESGCPMELGNRLFDLDWDRKYLHGGR